jgi:hypothetical protein
VHTKIADCVYIAVERALKRENIFIVCNFIALSFLFVEVFFFIIGVYIPASRQREWSYSNVDSSCKVSGGKELGFKQTNRMYALSLQGLLKTIFILYNILFIA